MVSASICIYALIAAVHAIRPTMTGARNIVDQFKDAPTPPGVAPSGLPTKSGYFQQRVDHFGNQTGVNGTWFNQLYYIQDTYYKPGSPIFFFIAGESAADDGWMTGGVGSILSWLLPRYNAMAVTLEHRFYGANADPSFPGRSVPTADLSWESLKLLTPEQAIEDNVNFIHAFRGLFPDYQVPKDTKWITIGGSYPGALSAWMREKHPKTVYAAHAASGPVQLQMNFWRYSYAVDEGMHFISESLYGNKDACMQGWTRAVKVLDTTIQSLVKNPTKLKVFKSQFWMSQITNNADFTTAVTSVMGGEVQYYPGATTVNGVTLSELVCSGKHYPAFVNPSATDVELLDALEKSWILQLQSYGYSGDNDPRIGAAFNTRPLLDDSLAGKAPYLWYYQACNQFGYGQVAQPLQGGLIENWSVYSQLNDVNYYEWTCNKAGYTKNASEAQIRSEDKKYGGLHITTDNILWVNGEYDPWHWLSNYQTAPGAGQDLLLFQNGTHCNDLWGPLGTQRAWPPLQLPNVDEEVGRLKEEIKRLGAVDPKSNKVHVKFGVLVKDDRCANIFEALVGTLKAAKKRKVIHYDAELLLQGVHDNVDIILNE